MKVVTSSESHSGEPVVTHTLQFDNGTELCTWYEVFYDGSGDGPIDAPFWHKRGRVHDWRNYVDEFQHCWDELTNVERMIVYHGAEREASSETWD